MWFKKVILFLLLFATNYPTFYIYAALPPGLIQLEKELTEELQFINYPPLPFGASEDFDPNDENPVYDVAIIGGGMAGLVAAAALFMEGIFNVQLFDQNPKGFEGPWLTYARMKTLRSEKNEMGPALGIPKLTFQAWYKAQFGQDSWDQLDKIPNILWMEYLNWYRSILNIPVENECKLASINYEGEYFVLEFNQNEKIRYVKAVKVVLATGRGGFGGPFLPDFVKQLPKKNYAHVMEEIDFMQLKDKVIGIIGGGASAFDAAATALEKGAKKVEMIIRSACLPCVNKFSFFHSQCFGLGYYKINEEWKWKMMSHILNCTVPPPVQSLKRVQNFSNFAVNSSMTINEVTFEENQIFLYSNKQKIQCDFLICATGYNIDGSQQPELEKMMDKIKLWKDCDVTIGEDNPHLRVFPYLGSKFEFLEKTPGEATYLKDLHCFNHASTLSHGAICRDITGISLGAKRLAEGIVADFLDKQKEIFFNSIENIEPDFDPAEFF